MTGPVSYEWGTSKEFQSYCKRMREVGQVKKEEPEFIAGRGESRTGDEHTDEHDQQWHTPQANGEKVLVVDLDTWKLTGANHGALFFEQAKP